MPPAHRRRPQSSRFGEVLMEMSKKRKVKRRRKEREKKKGVMKGEGGSEEH